MLLRLIICFTLAFIVSLPSADCYAEKINIKLGKEVNQSFKVDLSGSGQLYDANIKFVTESEGPTYILSLSNQVGSRSFKVPYGTGFLKVLTQLADKKEHLIYVINDDKAAIAEIQAIGLKDSKITFLLDPTSEKIIGNNGRIEDDLLGTILVFETELTKDDKPGKPLQKWVTSLKWDAHSSLYKLGKPEKLIKTYKQPSVQFSAGGWANY